MPYILGIVMLAGLAALGSSWWSLTRADAATGPDILSTEAVAGGAAGDEPLEGRVVLITGSTSGLGREVAIRTGALGAHVIVHGRNAERGMEVVRQIEEDGVGSASFHAADLASLAEVRRLGEEILRDYERVDVLINNAGIGRGEPGATRQESADGHELRFAVNYLSGFLLTRILLPRIIESAPARIVNVSSGAQAAIDFDDVMIERGYDGSRAYSQSKLAQILFTFDLAQELEGSGVIVNTLHPASLMPTRMVLERGAEPRSTIDEGADAVMQLVTADEIGSGNYYSGLEPARADSQAYDEEARERLRRLSRELTGVN